MGVDDFTRTSQWEPSSSLPLAFCFLYISGFSASRVFCLPPAYLLVLAEIISSTLKMKAICSSETSVATQQTTRRHIPEDDTFQVLVKSNSIW
jgi:hypothetical protein